MECGKYKQFMFSERLTKGMLNETLTALRDRSWLGHTVAHYPNVGK